MDACILYMALTVSVGGDYCSWDRDWDWDYCGWDRDCLQMLAVVSVSVHVV